MWLLAMALYGSRRFENAKSEILRVAEIREKLGDVQDKF